MGKATKLGVCSTHGLVQAERKTTYDLFGWCVAAISFFHWTPDTPYRCPKCGSLTTDPEPEA
jgi:hypothetical protein